MDRLPELAQMKEGSLRMDGPLQPGTPLVMRYHLECRSPGRLRFEGVKVHFGECQGFFSFPAFPRQLQDYRVLPMLVVEPGPSAFVKQHNVLPLLGTHRHM